MISKIIADVETFQSASDVARLQEKTVSVTTGGWPTRFASSIGEVESEKRIKEKLAAALQKQATLTQNPANNPYGVERLPWIFATAEALRGVKINEVYKASDFYSQPDKSIIWTANPRSVTWQINQRGSEAKNKSGTVLHVYHDRLRKTDYDDPKLNLSFQSGSILPSAKNATNPQGAASKDKSEISGGLTNFYQFLSLVDQPKIASDGSANLIHILYRSRIFPSMVITGFFDPQVVVQFTDDSQNPNQINSWTANFTVYSTTPAIYDFSELVKRFEAEGIKGF